MLFRSPRQFLARLNLDTLDEDYEEEEADGKYADLPEDVTSYLIQPEKATKIPGHHRKWVTGVVSGGKRISSSVILSDEKFANNENRIHGLVVRETIDCIRCDQVRVLVENHADTGVKLNKNFQFCHANVVIDPKIDWARGTYPWSH